MSITKRQTVLIAVVAAIICILGWGTVQANAETKINLEKQMLVAVGEDVDEDYYYDGKPHGEDAYSIYIVGRGNRINITDQVDISLEKQTDVGDWYVKVTAKEDSSYTGSGMAAAFEIWPKRASSLKMQYNKKTKNTTVSFKMPKLKKGYYEYFIYKGKIIDDPDDPSKSEKKRILKHDKSKVKSWKNKEKVKIAFPKKLAKGTYHVHVIAWDSAYTNESGKRKFDTYWANLPINKKLVVK